MKQPNKNRAARIVFTILAAFTVCFIFYNSLESQDQSAARSSRFLPILQYFIPWITHNQVHKLAHITEFATLSLWLSQILRVKDTFGLGLLVALCDETVQIFSHRGSSVADVWIDFCGVVLGWLAVQLLSTLGKIIKNIACVHSEIL